MPGDGCSAMCALESGYTCSTATPNVCTTICGDGLTVGMEACDDLPPAENGDGCSATCTVEPGFMCFMASPSLCATVCGDGLKAGNEACDDNNLTPGDGCSATCTIETGFTCSMLTSPSVCSTVCGDGLRAGSEVCDDNNLTPGDGCSATCAIEPGFTCSMASPSLCTTTCGDGVRAGTEACDDHNIAAGDGCSASCSIEAGFTCSMASPSVCTTTCGDGVRAGSEVCDDNNTSPLDGCSATCAIEPGFTCSMTPSICTTTCGDGVRAGLEACDDAPPAENGDGCSATCTVEPGFGCSGTAPSVCAPLCGNMAMDPGEQCDDGNQTSLDGCSPTCRSELTEAEPNEDGTPSTGGAAIAGNDFDVGGALAVNNATIQGVLNVTSGNNAWLAALTPAGDEDVFAITNNTPRNVELRLDVWNRATGFGQGVSCGTGSIDTGLNLRNVAGTVLASNDDRVGGDRCSGLTFILSAGATVYAHVVAFNDNATIAGYGLQVQFIPVVCGDSRQVPGFEECDDGNIMANDGCSATCTIEGVVESEPNEDGTPSTGGTGITGNDFDIGGTLAINNATAQGVLNIATGGRTWLGALSLAGDEDVFAITNPGPGAWEVQADTYDPTVGLNRACGASVDTGLNVRDAAGTVLVSNDQRPGGGDNCSRVIFVMAPGQTRYLHLTEFGDNSVVTRYALQVVRRALICGDTVQTPGAEECDDGNTMAGDGCSSTCTVEGITESEPNEDGTPSVGGTGIAGNDFDVGGTLAVNNANARGLINVSTGPVSIRAAMTPAGDEDVFAVTNSSTTATFLVQADTRDLTLGVNRPCTTVDTGLNVRDAAGVVISSNDNRATGDNCSRTTFTLAPGQTRYVHVTESGDNAVVTRYLLSLTRTQIVCGDGALAVGPEECDDQNTTPGDGCSATCQLEAPTESEPNGTTAEADASSVQITGSTLIRGSISVGTDLDTYRVVVATANTVRFETFSPIPGQCDTTTSLRLLGSTGTEIISDTNSGVGQCSAIVVFLQPGTYYVRVEETGTNAVIPKYFLEAAFNTDAGTETEPNETSIIASTNFTGVGQWVSGDHTMNADVDVYAITVPPGRGVRAEVIEGDRAVETCEGQGVDSRLTLYNSDGATVLVEDDDEGRGYCSLIDGTSSTPLDPTAKNNTAAPVTWYLSVRASSFAQGVNAAGQFIYKLQVTIR